MSWRATAFVKPLRQYPDGTKLTAREKLILFVLADSHNDEYDCAWLSFRRASEAALTSRRRFIELLGRLEDKGLITVERREGKTNLYRFVGLVQSSHPPKKQGIESHPTSAVAVAPGSAVAVAPKPLSNLQATDITPESATLSVPHEEKMRLLHERLDAWKERRWQREESGARFLISPSSGRKVYESELR